ncbi:uncharacterized protein LOC120352363 isoform X1 [Nilaparvata lugens]|uniref:uncharacterized protein LOC120352363 isoform X1 n=1 Tax=Nilaparvata lugens TaxID=108931 RepID=UPI00193D6703|nr:uncharacterized protein LOC120352363 isoform X1 [Nilaparvata lugens]
MAKRERGPNFIEIERNLIINLVSENILIIENKKTDFAAIQKKEETWNEISNKFNENALVITKQTKDQLRNFYENYKRKTKKAALTDKVEFYKTGGGTFNKSLDDEGERFVALMEPQFFPMKNYGDSDDGYHQKEIEIISMDAQAATSTDEVQDTEASVEVIDISEEEIIIQPSITVENNNLKRKTQSGGLGTNQKKKCTKI